MGLTKVFLKDGAYHRIEALRNERLGQGMADGAQPAEAGPARVLCGRKAPRRKPAMLLAPAQHRGVILGRIFLQFFLFPPAVLTPPPPSFVPCPVADHLALTVQRFASQKAACILCRAFLLAHSLRDPNSPPLFYRLSHFAFLLFFSPSQ